MLPNRKQWIGERQIDTAELMEEMLDSNGQPLVKIKYIQGGVEYFTQLMLQVCVTEKRIDASALRDLRCTPVAQAILKIYSDYGVKVMGEASEAAHINRMLAGTLSERFNQANEYLWGVRDDQITAIDMAAVLSKRDAAIKALNEQKPSGN